MTAGEPSTLVAAPFRPLTCSLSLHRDLFESACYAALPMREFSAQLAVLGALETLREELDAREVKS